MTGIVAPKKRESDQEALNALLKNLDRERVAKAFHFLKMKKFRFKDSEIHSPLGFLTHAIGEVLPLVEHEESKRAKAAERMTMSQASAVDAKKESEEFLLEQKEVWTKFQAAFPGEDLQHAELARLLQGTAFGPGTEIGRTVAVMKWAERSFVIDCN